ncbi:hypothetical protein Ait01nite_029750 [Actinoplanes italicus]|uniref:Uncharacterized protein n=1 Tax=Actinoplanes italicus TaxID=113567 RepID=A0A2T0KIS6_9ACTN|nr:hypothetical protein [Actinoplanes italicus]PRX23430.1 hypothetical protein CLV67_103177 [Actinoplanes italicus]GIE29930.1 hypothetical protein Ait01nite_029750 [Actinoplanes italicus]
MMERDDAFACSDRDPAPDDSPATSPADEELIVDPQTGRVGCRTELRGWAGAHLHGAVRPRRRAAGRGRPPGRWC